MRRHVLPRWQGKATCWEVSKPVVYKLKSYGKLKHSDELGMMTEIARNGPITCSIATPDDMVYGFRGGILRKKDYSKSEVNPAAAPQHRDVFDGCPRACPDTMGGAAVRLGRDVATAGVLKKKPF